MTHEEPDESLGLEGFLEPVDDDQGLSLDELSQAYADLMNEGHDPYEKAPDDDAPPELDEEDDEESDDAEEHEDEADDVGDDDACGISPLSILEAMLFVGHPNNEPLTSKAVASFMRGVRPREIDDLIVELNQVYKQEGCPFYVESAGAGYQMTLREEFGSIRENFYGRVKAAKLSQAAIDVLAIVAYKQPMTREDVDRLRGKPSGGLLNQLVRRELLRVERPQEKPRKPIFSTTDRFLQLFGIESLQDLPMSPD
jgi:segregation and condensation protein B